MGCSIKCYPQCDEDGIVLPHDHDEILDKDVLIRGIPRIHISEKDGRVSSSAFKTSNDKYGGLSISAKKILECIGKSVDDWAESRFVAVACFPVKILRDEKIQVGWDPRRDDPSVVALN